MRSQSELLRSARESGRPKAGERESPLPAKAVHAAAVSDRETEGGHAIQLEERESESVQVSEQQGAGGGGEARTRAGYAGRTRFRERERERGRRSSEGNQLVLRRSFLQQF